MYSHYSQFGGRLSEYMYSCIIRAAYGFRCGIRRSSPARCGDMRSGAETCGAGGLHVLLSGNIQLELGKLPRRPGKRVAHRPRVASGGCK